MQGRCTRESSAPLRSEGSGSVALAVSIRSPTRRRAGSWTWKTCSSRPRSEISLTDVANSMPATVDACARRLTAARSGRSTVPRTATDTTNTNAPEWVDSDGDPDEGNEVRSRHHAAVQSSDHGARLAVYPVSSSWRLPARWLCCSSHDASEERTGETVSNPRGDRRRQPCRLPRGIARETDPGHHQSERDQQRRLTERYHPATMPTRSAPSVMANAARVTVMRKSASVIPPRNAVVATCANARRRPRTTNLRPGRAHAIDLRGSRRLTTAPLIYPSGLGLGSLRRRSTHRPACAARMTQPPCEPPWSLQQAVARQSRFDETRLGSDASPFLSGPNYERSEVQVHRVLHVFPYDPRFVGEDFETWAARQIERWPLAAILLSEGAIRTSVHVLWRRNEKQTVNGMDILSHRTFTGKRPPPQVG